MMEDMYGFIVVFILEFLDGLWDGEYVEVCGDVFCVGGLFIFVWGIVIFDGWLCFNFLGIIKKSCKVMKVVLK